MMKKLIQRIKNKFKFSCWFNRRLNKQFISIFLIPTIDFTYDSQGNQTLKFEDCKEVFPSVIEVYLSATWLWFHTGVELEIFTNKPITEIDD